MSRAGVEGHMLSLSLYMDKHGKPVILCTIHQQKSDGLFLTLPEEIHFLFAGLPLHQHAQEPVLLCNLIDHKQISA